MSISREEWSGKISFMLSSLGAALGLGQIWMFPYIAGKNGGAIFILLYILSLFIVAIPVLCAEIIIGKKTKTNPIHAIKKISKKYDSSKLWNIWGVMGLLTGILILSFYSVVTGYTAYYLGQSVIGNIPLPSPDKYPAIWKELHTDVINKSLYTTIVIALTFTVVMKGVTTWLEKINKLVIPILLIIVVALAIHSLFFSKFDSKLAINFLFNFDISQITAQLVIQAIGQAFFSLAVGIGAMMMYGSYLNQQTGKIYNLATGIAICQLLVGILIGITIFTIVFGVGFSADCGPSLMFVTLPMALDQLGNSHIIMFCFFFAIFFAAFTSAINIAELLVGTLHEISNISRKYTSLILMLLLLIISNYLGYSEIAFENIIILSTNVLLPLCAFTLTLFVSMVLPKDYFIHDLGIKKSVYKYWHIFIKYIIPAIIFIILINSLYTSALS